MTIRLKYEKPPKLRMSITDCTFTEHFSNTNHADHSVVFCFLANIACRVGSNFYVKMPNGSWRQIKGGKESAIATIYQNYGGGIAGANSPVIYIDRNMIKEFMACAMVEYANVTYAPFYSDFVFYNNESRLNLFRDLRIKPDATDPKLSTTFLQIIRNALCDEDEVTSYDDMLAEINGTGKTEFRFVMHWLASCYQNYGHTIGTNLWFCDAGQGIGKGSLIESMKFILKACKKLSAGEINNEWLDELFASVLTEWDEFKGQGWHDKNTFIKTVTGNNDVAIRSRNVGSVLQPATSNHIMTTNENNPMFLEGDDRRNVFIKSLNKEKVEKYQHWSSIAFNFHNGNTFEKKCEIFQAFANVLNAIDIDMAFISRPLETAKKLELQSFHADDDVQLWFEGVCDDENIFKFLQYGKCKDLYSEYTDFAKEMFPNRRYTKSYKEFRAKMFALGYMDEKNTKPRGRHIELKTMAVNQQVIPFPPRGDNSTNTAKEINEELGIFS